MDILTAIRKGREGREDGYKYLEYEIIVDGAAMKHRLRYFVRTRDGIMEERQKGNHFSHWTVTSGIPDGAKIIWRDE